MELDLTSRGEECYLKKYLFNLKAHRNDGLILQVHHSYVDSVGENKRYKFMHASFNDYGTHLAIADHKGNVFVIDLEMEKYWQLPVVGLPTVISFPVLKTQELLIGLDTSNIVIIHIETGNLTGVLNGHSVPAVEVSYSDDGRYYLTSSSGEAIVWDSSSFCQIHRLSLKADVCLKKAIFMPVTNHILACFPDDTMHVWKFGTFECVKQIIPEAWRTHHLKAIAITKNGRAMVVGGQTPNLVVFCLDTWVVKKVIEFPENISGIKQMKFVPQAFDGGANKILALLTTSLEIFFFNIETSIFLKGMHQIFGVAAKITVSCNGKYLATILTSGEVNIYTVEKILSNKKELHDAEELPPVPSKSSFNHMPPRNQTGYSKRTQKSVESLMNIHKQLKEILDVKKLLPILKQFGEYPESYRILIWKTILKLPSNQECFLSLSAKRCHSSFSKLELKYPLVNKSLCNSLKKLLSNLSHWCPLFGEVDFLPEFTFPFVKLFHCDPLGCFEIVATIVVNWCQNWFEFYPFPPINMLSALENILGYHDPDLLEHYLKNNVTSSISVCPLFHTSFSEVLSKAEWMRLWDHILSNEPSFLFMAIVAYNVVCRNAIKSFVSCEDLEKFFHKQNPIDMKMFIGKTYQFLKDTPADLHCRQFFKPFRPLGSGGTYISFLAYPKLIVDPNTEKLQSIRQEEEELLEEQMKALSIKKELDKKLKEETNVEEQQKIYRDLEDKIRKTVEAEEDRMLTQRQRLQNLKQELRLRELEVLENTRDKALKEKVKQKEFEFERLLKDISRRKAREKADVEVIEEEVRKYYSELLLRKCQLEMDLGLKDFTGDGRKVLEKESHKLNQDLAELQDEWTSSQHFKRIDISNKMAAVKSLLCDLETEIAKDVAGKRSEKNARNRAFVNELKKKVETLEEEIERLLIENLNKMKRRKEEAKATAGFYPYRKLKSPHYVVNHRPVPRQNRPPSNSKVCAGCSGSPKVQRIVESYSTMSSPNVQTNITKVTTFRSKVTPLPRPKTSVKIDEVKPVKPKLVDKTVQTNPEQVRPKSTKSRPSRTKSKFTCTDGSRSTSSVGNATTGSDKSLGRRLREAISEYLKDNKDLTVQSKGDFEGKTLVEDEKETPLLPEFHFNKGDRGNASDSENEVIKSALRTRQQLVDEAKRRQEI